MIRKKMSIMLVVLFITSTVAFADQVQLPKTGQTTKYAAVDDGDLQKGAEWPTPRFAVSGDCITDNLTRLMWAKNGNMPNSKKTWQDALDYISSLNGSGGLCGYRDWRLPKVKELSSLVTAEKSNTTAWLNSQGFSNVQSTGYWSSIGTDYITVGESAVLAVGGQSFSFNMNEGRGGYPYKSTSCYVWPVRSGQSKK